MEQYSITGTDRHSEIEVARAPNGDVNEIYHYTEETRDEEAKTWSYLLEIVRIGGRPMTDEEIREAVGVR